MSSDLCSCGRGNFVEPGRDECYRCRVMGVSFGFRGSVRHGRGDWNRTAREWKLEYLGTDNDRELAARGIERAD